MRQQLHVLSFICLFFVRFYDACLYFQTSTFSTLSRLELGCKDAAVVIRVSRAWEYKNGMDDGPIVRVDMVLIDRQVRL